MKTIYKYPVSLTTSKFSIPLPADYKFLRVAFQGEDLFMWVELSPDMGKSEVKFAIYVTGEKIPPSASYLQTFDHGPYVLHLYRL